MALSQRLRIPPKPGARDDAAADASHQAAAALEPGSGGLCRGELERNPLLERPADERRPAERRAPSAAGARVDRRHGATGDRDPAPAMDRRNLETSRSAIEERLGTDLENEFPDDGGPARAQQHRPRSMTLVRLGRMSAPAAARTATTISNPSCRPSGRWPTISPSSLRLRSPTRCSRMIGRYLIDMVDEAGYLRGDLDDGVPRSWARRWPRSRRCWRCCRPSIRRACARAISPSASRSSCASAIASIRRCRRWSAGLILLAQARSRGAAKDLRRQRRGSHRHDRRDPRGSIPSRASPSAQRWCSRWCPTFMCGRAPTAPSMVELNSDTLPKVLVNQRYHAKLIEERARTTATRRYLRGMSPDRDLADARARSARQDDPEGRDGDREAAGWRSSCTACSICGR